MHVLVIAPHMDDEVLGCGGIILKHKDRGDKVWVIFVANRIYAHKYNEKSNRIERSHARMSKKKLGYDEVIFLDLPDERLDVSLQEIIIPLEKHIYEINPSIVYIPFKGDNNQDHRAVFDAARVVLRPSATPFIEKIYMYEVPSSTDQSPPISESVFAPNFYANIKKYMDQKIEAFRCYETEKRAYPHPRSEEALQILARKRGIETGFEYAEAFITLRDKWE